VTSIKNSSITNDKDDCWPAFFMVFGCWHIESA
jgi:hypothetical protein